MQTWEVIAVRKQGVGLLWIVLQLVDDEAACVTVAYSLSLWGMLDDVGYQWGYGD